MAAGTSCRLEGGHILAVGILVVDIPEVVHIYPEMSEDVVDARIATFDCSDGELTIVVGIEDHPADSNPARP